MPTTEQKEDIVRRYTKGTRIPAIARMLGFAYETVSIVLREAGLVVRKKRERGPLTAEESAAAIAAYATGLSTLEVGKKLGITSSMVNGCLRRAGVPLRPKGFRCGDAHHGWVGGKVSAAGGYVLVLIHKDDPYFCMAVKKMDSAMYVLEHRLVMARHLGRPLRRSETVHHIDGNRTNNDIRNLQLRQGKHGKGQVAVCADCGSHNITYARIADAA